MPIGLVVVVAVVVGTLVPWTLHHQVHGVWSVHQMALAFFLWLNFIIALWEICLFLSGGKTVLEKRLERQVAH